MTLMLLAGFVYAAEVNQAGVKTFRDGDLIIADEMNNTLTTLIQAINDNAQRIAALEAANSDDVSGRTYEVFQIGAGTQGAPGSGEEGANDAFATVTTFSERYTVTFRANGTLSLAGTESEAEVNTISGDVTVWLNENPVSVQGSWSQSGSSLEVVLGDTVLPFSVSADGNVIVFREFSTRAVELGRRSQNGLVVGVAVE